MATVRFVDSHSYLSSWLTNRDFLMLAASRAACQSEVAFENHSYLSMFYPSVALVTLTPDVKYTCHVCMCLYARYEFIGIYTLCFKPA